VCPSSARRSRSGYDEAMETTESPVIDKSEWGDGPWMSEPDRVDFIHAGFACFALRHPDLGHWCGYVGVPREHPLYGTSHDDVDVEFHGGLTYSDTCRGGICHEPAPGMPDDVWWLGGDFAHFCDFSPAMRARLRSLGFDREHDDIYRDLPYVRRQIEQLAEQLSALAQGARG
jgi:hypothetical protein